MVSIYFTSILVLPCRPGYHQPLQAATGIALNKNTDKRQYFYFVYVLHVF